MRQFTVLFAVLMISAAATAGVILPKQTQTQPTTPWEALIQKMVQEGTPSFFQQFELRALSKITPDDVTKPRTAEYISAVGGANSMGAFTAMEVHAVSENWTIDADGNWVIEQWIFKADLAGELTEAYHQAVIKTAESTVVGWKDYPSTPEEEKANWEKKKAEWLQ